MKREEKKKKSVALLIRALRKAGNERKEKLWKDLAERLSKPRRTLACVNIWKINRAAAKAGGKLLLVPGKVLGNGELSGKVEVAALEFSESAARKIRANGSALSVQQLLESKRKAAEIVVVK